ncbi:MAG TPA: SpoVG family protein [Candidatus Krumholzibacteria bacterium]|nr:SpoVG family protein [Candidatus Krumholzibacteria bacterium]HRY40331.1 SpoVG family protein [Candidatus Krumholzibacteria bacterium]
MTHDAAAAAEREYGVKITEIRITLRDDNKLKGFASITLDDSFVIRGLKIIEGASGPFIAMPSRKRKDGTFQDIAHPINMETREWMEGQIIAAYKQEVQRMESGEIRSGSGGDHGDDPGSVMEESF